jgi:hypothetical protein
MRVGESVADKAEPPRIRLRPEKGDKVEFGSNLAEICRVFSAHVGLLELHGHNLHTLLLQLLLVTKNEKRQTHEVRMEHA